MHIYVPFQPDTPAAVTRDPVVPRGPYGAGAGGEPVDMNATLTIDAEGTPVTAVLDEITRKKGIRFAYDPEDIRQLPAVTGHFKNIRVYELLGKCLEGTNFKYETENDFVVIYDTSGKTRKFTVSGTVYDPNKNPLAGASVILKGGNGRGRLRRRRRTLLDHLHVEDQSGRARNRLPRHGEPPDRRDRFGQGTEGLAQGGRHTDRGRRGERHVHPQQEHLHRLGDDDQGRGPRLYLEHQHHDGAQRRDARHGGRGQTPSAPNPNAIPEILIRGSNSIATSAEEKAYNNPLIILDGAEITMEEALRPRHVRDRTDRRAGRTPRRPSSMATAPPTA